MQCKFRLFAGYFLTKNSQKKSTICNKFAVYENKGVGMKICKPEYLQRVATLTKEEQERVMSRMAGKLPKRLQKDKLSVEEAIAIQLEIEDEQLHEWRQHMQAIKAEAEKKASKQAIKAEKKQIPTIKKEIAKAAKSTAPAKPKATAKPKAAAKPKATSPAATKAPSNSK
jgi:hypothetical protein